MDSQSNEWDEYREQLKEEFGGNGIPPEGYTDFYTPARDAYLRERLKDFPETKFESFSMSFVVNSPKNAPLVFAILERIPLVIIDKNNVSIEIRNEQEFLSGFNSILDLFYVVRYWKTLSLCYNGVDFNSSIGFGFLTHYLREKHKDILWNKRPVQYLPKKTRERKKVEVSRVRISQNDTVQALNIIVDKYAEIYGKKKDIRLFVISKHEKVVMLENSLIVDFRMMPRHVYQPSCVKDWDNPCVMIQELTYNELFKFNFTGFRRNFDSDCVGLDFYNFHSQNYYTSNNAVFNSVDKKLPELNLRKRLEDFPGEIHHFIILRIEDAEGGIQYGVGETRNKVHTFVLNLCKELEEKNPRSIAKYSVSCLPIEKNCKFIQAFISWKGEKKRWRLENKFSYYYEDRPIRNEIDSFEIKDKIIAAAYAGRYDSCEFGTYTKPLNKWKSEEFVYNITKKIYKDYQVIYQYKPYFLNTGGGGMSYDVYICGLKTAIEYQGKQHFEPVEYFGGAESFQGQQERDKLKAELSRENGVKLVYINYWEDITAELIRERVEG